MAGDGFTAALRTFRPRAMQVVRAYLSIRIRLIAPRRAPPLAISGTSSGFIDTVDRVRVHAGTCAHLCRGLHCDPKKDTFLIYL